MRIRISDLALATVVLSLLAFVVAGSLAQDKAPVGPENPDAIAAQTDERPIIVAMFYSGFCSACRVLDPKIDAIKPEFADRPVTFLTFDQTFSALGGRDARTDLAAEYGISQIWDQNKGKQGFAIVADPATGRALDVLTMRNSEDDIRAAIDAALQQQHARIPSLAR